MQIDVEKFRSLKEYINEIKSKTSLLIIWNYTPKAQYENFWPEEQYA